MRNGFWDSDCVAEVDLFGCGACAIENDCNGNSIPDECELGIEPPEFNLETGPQGVPNGGLTINACQFPGARFSLNRPHLITSVGGQVQGSSFGGDRDIFVAIVPISGNERFPSDPALSEAVFAAVVEAPILDPPQVPDTVINTSFVLDPGKYAIFFGSGLFGATGSGWMPLSDLGQESLLWWCSIEDFFNSTQSLRFLVHGTPVVPLDCNANGVPDECDPDENGNGIPDACEK